MEPSKLDHCVISGIVTRTICKIYRPRKSNVNALTGIISKQLVLKDFDPLCLNSFMFPCKD